MVPPLRTVASWAAAETSQGATESSQKAYSPIQTIGMWPEWGATATGLADHGSSQSKKFGNHRIRDLMAQSQTGHNAANVRLHYKGSPILSCPGSIRAVVPKWLLMHPMGLMAAIRVFSTKKEHFSPSPVMGHLESPLTLLP